MQKGFAPLLILVGILAIIGVAGGAYFFGKSQTPQFLTQPTSVPDETTNWKIYQDLNNIFSFKYDPESKIETNDYGWIFVESKSSSATKPIPSTNTAVTDRCGSGDGSGVSLLYSYLGGETFKDYVVRTFEHEKKEYTDVSSLSPIFINGVKGYQYSMITGFCLNKTKVIYLPDKDDHFVLIVTSDSPNQKVNKILSTFKFTQ